MGVEPAAAPVPPETDTGVRFRVPGGPGRRTGPPGWPDRRTLTGAPWPAGRPSPTVRPGRTGGADRPGYARRVTRQDVRRNRRLIVAAAAQVFREHGATAPLGLVAERAGVGRATLYRHFPDRRTLAAAVLDLRVGVLEEFVARHPGADLLDRLLVEIWTLQLDTPGLIATARGEDGEEALTEPVARTRALLAEALDQARRHGAVASEVGLGEVFVVLAMIEGVIAARDRLPDDVGVGAAMALALRSLRSAERLGLPVPAATVRVAAARVPDDGA